MFLGLFAAVLGSSAPKIYSLWASRRERQFIPEAARLSSRAAFAPHRTAAPIWHAAIVVIWTTPKTSSPAPDAGLFLWSHVNWFTRRARRKWYRRRHGRARAPILFVESGAHSRDHIGGRTRSRDLGDVPRRMIFQEEAGHEIRSARHLS
jgi:hypothetical protein